MAEPNDQQPIEAERAELKLLLAKFGGDLTARLEEQMALFPAEEAARIDPISLTRGAWVVGACAVIEALAKIVTEIGPRGADALVGVICVTLDCMSESTNQIAAALELEGELFDAKRSGGSGTH